MAGGLHGTHAPPCEQNDRQTRVKTLPCHNFVAGGNNICTLLTVIISAHANFVEICPYLLPNSTDCFPKSMFTGGYMMCGFEMETQLSEPSKGNYYNHCELNQLKFLFYAP